MKKYKITKDFPSTIVKDFFAFLEYCEKVKPLISKTKEFINRKASFTINQMLTNPHEGLTNKSDQNHYPQIHLFYHLALNGALFHLDRSRKSKPCFVPNKEQITRFRNLNPSEQYLFLFQCFYVYSDFALIDQDECRFFGVNFFEEDLKILAKSEVDKSYSLTRFSKAKEKIQLSFGGLLRSSSMLLYGQYFGLWEVTKLPDNMGYNTKTHFEVDTLTLTTFGKDFLTFLVKNAPISLWNQPYRHNEGDRFPLGIPLNDKIYEAIEAGKDIKSLIKKVQRQYLSFFSVMQRFFTRPIQSDFEIKLKKPKQQGNFTLEIEMEYIKPKVSRTLQLGNHLTLEELHYGIISAIDFDDDHLYAFYMDKKKRNSYGRLFEHGEPPFASDFSLDDFDLYPNKRFYYTFDFGDNWQFIITVKDFEQTDKLLSTPKLIAQSGTSPEQYPSWDEDEDW